MIKSEIRSIHILPKEKIIKVSMRCCFMHIICYESAILTPEQRPYFECEEFWTMLGKLTKKHKLQEHAPSPSLEEDMQLFDLLEYFWDVTYEEEVA